MPDRAPAPRSNALREARPALAARSTGPARFDSCRCALHAVAPGAPAGAPPEPIAYRRCPVGVIADVDCPEFVGTRCRFHDDRGALAPTVVPRSEVALLAAELSADYLTPRYLRRVRRLRASAGGVQDAQEASRGPRGAELLAASPPSPPAAASATASSAPVRHLLVADAPLNVPADRDRRRLGGARPVAAREDSAP